MHEYSLCENIIKIVLDEIKSIKPTPVKINRVSLVIGEMHQVIEENLKFSFDILSKNTMLEGSSLEIIFLPVKLKCLACGNEDTLVDNEFFCKHCESFNVDIIEGRELFIKSIEVD